MSGPTTTFPLLAARFLAANPTPSAALTRCLTNYGANWDAGGLPIAVMRLASDVDNTIDQETVGQPGLIRDTYHVLVYIFLGVLTGPDLPPQYHEIAKPWGQALGKALAADRTLGGAVTFIGEPASRTLFRYRVGVIPWPLTQTNYWGLTVTLPVTEKVSTNVG